MKKLVVLDRIKDSSKAMGWSLSFLASKLGLTASYFTDVKNGKTKIPEYRLIAIAELLNTTPEYLKGETDIKEKPISQNSTNGLNNVYFRLAKALQDDKIDPDDIRLALDTIKRLREKK